MSSLFGSHRWLRLMLVALPMILGCSPQPQPNILLIVVDTLRPDHLPAYGYERESTPELDRHLAGAEVFERAYSAASYTSASVVSMLSGLWPTRHGVQDFFVRLPDEVEILPDHLGRLGYQTAGIVSSTILTDEALGLASRFDHWDDFVDERELNRNIYERRASRTTDAALRWLVLERDPDRSHFILLHYIDPHAPYAPPEDVARAGFSHEGRLLLEGELPRYQRLPGVDDAYDYVDAYDEEIAYLDRELGRFLAAYGERGLLDDALVIFTSDHGETLLEHTPRFSHSPSIWSEVLRVPLVIRWPGGDSARSQVPVSLVDLVPTILDHLGVEPADGLQGVPLRARGEEDMLLQESWRASSRDPRRLRSVTRGVEKWTFRVNEAGAVQPLWYTDLSVDPLEARPTEGWGDHDEIRERVELIVEAERASASRTPTPERGRRIRGPKAMPELDPHQREALEALGYIQ